MVLAGFNDDQAADRYLSAVGQHNVGDFRIHQHILNLLSGKQVSHVAHTALIGEADRKT